MSKSFEQELMELILKEMSAPLLEDLPVEFEHGVLRACFNKMGRGAGLSSAKASWLHNNFGGLDIVKGTVQFTAALPQAYDLQPTKHKGQTRTAPHGRLQLKPLRLQAKGLTAVDALGKLYENIMALNTGWDHEVLVYRPKQGQNPEILIPGKTYSCIQHEDPVHDHDSADLIDFTIKPITPRIQRVGKLPFEINHVHIMSRKLAP